MDNLNQKPRQSSWTGDKEKEEEYHKKNPWHRRCAKRGRRWIALRVFNYILRPAAFRIYLMLSVDMCCDGAGERWTVWWTTIGRRSRRRCAFKLVEYVHLVSLIDECAELNCIWTPPGWLCNQHIIIIFTRDSQHVNQAGEQRKESSVLAKSVSISTD